MQSEAEIRQHLADLEWTHAQPCTCSTPEQRAKCRMDRLLLRAAIGTLAWVIGDHPGYAEVVREMTRVRAAGESIRCQEASRTPGKEI